MPNASDYQIPSYIPDPPEDDFESSMGGTARPSLPEGLPSSIQTEVTVLGAMMVDGDARQEGLGRLNANDFALDSHQRIFKAIKTASSNLPIGDPGEELLLEVMHELTRTRELEAIGNASYLAFLTEGIPRNPNIESYVRIIKDKGLLRQLCGIFNDGMIAAADQSENGVDIATRMESAISEAVESNQVRTEVFDSPTLAADAVDRLLDNPSDEEAIPTGFSPLDEFTNGGIRLGEVWIVGASPSRGKTTLARQIVKHSISRGTPCYVHSGEMTKESWYDVTACLIADMQAWKVREPRLMNQTDKELLRAGIKELATLPLHISDAGGIHIDKLLWNAYRAIREHKIKLFAIDYAQIINAGISDPKQRLTAIAQKIRVFGKENNIATLLLSQSARPEARHINSRPNMFSLKESGSLEESAHTVILPYRPVDLDTEAFTGEDELIIAKNRWGPIGTVPCKLDGKFLKFVERKIADV